MEHDNTITDSFELQNVCKNVSILFQIEIDIEPTDKVRSYISAENILYSSN